VISPRDSKVTDLGQLNGIQHSRDGQKGMILAVTAQAALAPQASAKDDPRGPQWHFMNTAADMRLATHPWCVPNAPRWATCSHKGSDWTSTARVAPDHGAHCHLTVIHGRLRWFRRAKL
jgi:hypothetical protein